MEDQILFVHSSDELYGADRVLGYVLDSLTDEERGRARVWLPSDLEHGAFPLCERIEAMGVRVDHVPLPIVRRANLNPRGLADLARRSVAFRRYVSRVDVDVVYGTTSATLPALAALSGGPWRVLLHNQEVWKPREAKVLAAMAHDVDRVIAISEATRDSMPAILRDRSTVVANTTPDPFDSVGFRAVDELAPSPLRVLAAGRWTANKGFDVLIAAWNHAPIGELTIVGGPPPSGAALDIDGMVAQSPVRDSITLIREVDSIIPLLSESHIVVMPSTWDEPFGLVALEGMAAGRPVIASEVGGLAQFVNSDVGWLVPRSDPAALADVLRSMSHDSVIVKGAHARSEYLGKFSPQRFRRAWRDAVGLS